MRRAIAAAAAAILLGAGAGAAIGLSGGGGNGQDGPSVAACERAYPAWFAASAAAGYTTATPEACQGLSQSQVAAIASRYLASQGQR